MFVLNHIDVLFTLMGKLAFLSGKKKWTQQLRLFQVRSIPPSSATVISTIAAIRLQCDSAASGNIFQFSPFFRLLFLSLFFAPPNPPPPPPPNPPPFSSVRPFSSLFFGPLSGRDREWLLERQPVVDQATTVAAHRTTSGQDVTDGTACKLRKYAM